MVRGQCGDEVMVRGLNKSNVPESSSMDELQNEFDNGDEVMVRDKVGMR